MATLLELNDLLQDSTLTKKVSSALLIGIKTRLDGTPTANDRAYAGRVFTNPLLEAHRVLKYVLAANAGASVAAIQGATDATIQANVDAALPILIAADAGA